MSDKLSFPLTLLQGNDHSVEKTAEIFLIVAIIFYALNYALDIYCYLNHPNVIDFSFYGIHFVSRHLLNYHQVGYVLHSKAGALVGYLELYPFIVYKGVVIDFVCLIPLPFSLILGLSITPWLRIINITENEVQISPPIFLGMKWGRARKYSCAILEKLVLTRLDVKDSSLTNVPEYYLTLYGKDKKPSIALNLPDKRHPGLFAQALAQLLNIQLETVDA